MKLNLIFLTVAIVSIFIAVFFKWERDDLKNSLALQKKSNDVLCNKIRSFKNALERSEQARAELNELANQDKELFDWDMPIPVDSALLKRLQSD